MAKSETYTLSVGEEDKRRLSALNYFCNPYTWQALDQSNLDLKSKVIVDVGCGSGDVTIELAKRAGAAGKVFAIDISEEQLALAKQLAEEQGLANIQFICCDVNELDSLDIQADMVYSRFVLEHLHNQQQVLQKMVGLLNKGGYLFCETVTSYAAIFSDPANEAFDRWHAVVLKQPELFGTDFYLGKKLYSYLQELGLKTMYAQLQQPLMQRCQQRTDFFSGLQNPGTQQAFLEKGGYSKQQLDTIVEDVLQFVEQSSLIGFVQYLQIIAQK